MREPQKFKILGLWEQRNSNRSDVTQSDVGFA